MLKKRIIGVITVKGNWAVQSFGYRRYLPLGRPETLAENLERWGVDEILLQCIDRSSAKLGPNYDVLECVAKTGLSTPLIYSGGIHTVAESLQVIKAGADRIAVDALLYSARNEDTACLEIKRITEALGVQAVMAAIPLSFENNEISHRDYCGGKNGPLMPNFLDLLHAKLFSECIIIDWKNEGGRGTFDQRLLESFSNIEQPLIPFGGVSEIKQISELLLSKCTSAVAIGNFLHYKEHAIINIKRELGDCNIRFSDESLVNH